MSYNNTSDVALSHDREKKKRNTAPALFHLILSSLLLCIYKIKFKKKGRQLSFEQKHEKDYLSRLECAWTKSDKITFGTLTFVLNLRVEYGRFNEKKKIPNYLFLLYDISFFISLINPEIKT